jgi:hypothetical protein
LRPKKIFILLPDGVGLRNFAYTTFIHKGKELGWDVIFWNKTKFDLTKMGFKEIKLIGKPRAKSDLIKRAKIIAELDYFSQIFNDNIYQSYKFPSRNKDIKSLIKNFIITQLIRFNRGKNGLIRLREKLKASERKSTYYRSCLEVLKREKPDFIFCTNQRPLSAISPLTAAQDLGIQTGTFIFSWDNLPKATLIVEPNFYFVWSAHMKKELITYYPYINPSHILVTGSPQFEMHTNPNLLKSREDFFKENFLDLNKDYICFSGDDVTTSPDDASYLKDVAEAVKKLNNNGNNIGIIFRRCPVDLSDRYSSVLRKYKDLIFPVSPKWQKIGENWNAVMPTHEDLTLQLNTIYYTLAVINLGSSMVFDYALLNKPCLFLNYDVDKKLFPSWTSKVVYKFIHFRSMPTGNEVIWLNSKTEISFKLHTALNNPSKTVKYAKDWFNKINLCPPEDASTRIWLEVEKILKT